MPVMETPISTGTRANQDVTVDQSRLCSNPFLKEGQIVTARAFSDASEAQPDLVQESHTESIGPELVCSACGACALRDLPFRRGADCQGPQPAVAAVPHPRVGEA